MSWEECSRRRNSCPCGEGEYEEVGYSDDWGRYETRRNMLCPKCKEKYVYDHTVIYGHPGNEIERGWVLKSVLDEEARYRRRIKNKAKELYYVKWKSLFENAKTKKEMWRILTLNGEYYPSLGTFYKHTKGYDKEELTKEIDRYFNYYDLKRVFEICGVEPDWEYLGVNDKDIKRFRPENLSNVAAEDLADPRPAPFLDDRPPSCGVSSSRNATIQRTQGLRLRIELVPSTSWYNSLRKNMIREDWDKIRKGVYADYGYRCGICGVTGRLNCHEVWEYNDNKHIQKLAGFVALCDLCHHVKHIGLAGILASNGELDYDEIIEHFMRVNNCDRTSFEEHRKRALEIWRERSQHQWNMDLGRYKDMIKSVSDL